MLTFLYIKMFITKKKDVHYSVNYTLYIKATKLKTLEEMKTNF